MNPLEKVLDEIEKTVYANISLEPIHIDTLCRTAQLSINVLQLALMKLELWGMIEQLPNKHFIKSKLS